MNYKKAYDIIIENAKNKKRIKGNGIYYELHHILPKCLGGLGEAKYWKYHPNLVLLTAREHFICHMLLTKIYNNYDIKFAFKCISSNEKYNSRSYEKMKSSSFRPGFSWYTDGLNNIKVYKNDIIPKEFNKGFALKPEKIKIKKELKEAKRLKNEKEKLEIKKLKKEINDKIRLEKITERRRLREIEHLKIKKLIKINNLKNKLNNIEKKFLDKINLDFDDSKDFLVNNIPRMEDLWGRHFSEEELIKIMCNGETDFNDPINEMNKLIVEEYLYLKTIKLFPETVSESLKLFYKKYPWYSSPNKHILEKIYTNPKYIERYFGKKFIPLAFEC